MRLGALCLLAALAHAADDHGTGFSPTHNHAEDVQLLTDWRLKEDILGSRPASCTMRTAVADARFAIDRSTVSGPYDILDTEQCCDFCVQHGDCVGYQIFNRHQAPTDAPTSSPTDVPTAAPTEPVPPSDAPTLAPTNAPTPYGIQVRVYTSHWPNPEAGTTSQINVQLCYCCELVGGDGTCTTPCSDSKVANDAQDQYCNPKQDSILGGSDQHQAEVAMDGLLPYSNNEVVQALKTPGVAHADRTWPTHLRITLGGTGANTDNWCLGQLDIKRSRGGYQMIYETRCDPSSTNNDGCYADTATATNQGTAYAATNADANCNSPSNLEKDRSPHWFGTAGTDIPSRVFSVPTEITSAPTDAPTAAPTAAPTNARRRLDESSSSQHRRLALTSSVPLGECYIATSIPYYYAAQISPLSSPFYRSASMYLLNQSHADGRSRHPSAVSFSPAGGTYTHPSAYVDTRFSDDRKPLSIVLGPESTTPEAYGPLSLSDIGDTTKVSWHTASGWTANMSANTQFGNELAGWPDRVRMFAGDQAYTTSTARVFTASGKRFTVSPSGRSGAGEYSIETGPSGYASRKIRYCIEMDPPQSSHTEGCFADHSVYTDYTGPIPVDSIGLWDGSGATTTTVTVFAYVQQNSSTGQMTPGLITSAKYTLTADPAHSPCSSDGSCTEWFFTGTAKLSEQLQGAAGGLATDRYADAAEVDTEAFAVALVQTLPRAVLSRVSSSVTVLEKIASVSFAVAFDTKADAEAAAAAWGSLQTSTAGAVRDAAKDAFANRMTAAMIDNAARTSAARNYKLNPLRMRNRVTVTVDDFTVDSSTPGSGSVNQRTMVPTKFPTKSPAFPVTNEPTAQPTKWYDPGVTGDGVQTQECPSGTMKVNSALVSSSGSLTQFVASGGMQADFVCVKCPKGKYQAMGGQSACVACPMGQYAGSLGMSSCSSAQCKSDPNAFSYGGNNGETLCWVSREGDANNLEVKWQSFEEGRELTAIGWGAVTNAHPRWKLASYNFTGHRVGVSQMNSVYDMSVQTIRSIFGAGFPTDQANATFSVQPRSAVYGDHDDSTEPRPTDPIRYVRPNNGPYVTDAQNPSRVKGDGFWFFRADAVFVDSWSPIATRARPLTLGCPSSTRRTDNSPLPQGPCLHFVVDQPQKPAFTKTPLPQYVQPTQTLTLTAEATSRPAAHARWIRDGTVLVEAPVPFVGTSLVTDSDPDLLSRVVLDGGRVVFEQRVVGGRALGSTNLADNNGGAPTIEYKLIVTPVRRTDHGEYQLELSNYAGTSNTGADGSVAGALVQVACRACNACVPNAVPGNNNSHCVCADGYYNRRLEETSYDKTKNPLGFECVACPEGATCNGNPTIEEIVTNPQWYRHEKTDTQLYPCRAGGGGNYVRSTGACVGGRVDVDVKEQCKFPYLGIMCSSCEKGWFVVLDDRCDKCPERHRNIKMKLGMRLLMTISFFVGAYLLTIIIRLPIRTMPKSMRDQRDRDNHNDSGLNTSADSDLGHSGIALNVDDDEGDPHKDYWKGYGRNPVTIARVKILLSWLQCIGPVALTFAVQWPHEFRKTIYTTNTIFMLDFVEMARNVGWVACEFPTDFQTGFWPHMLMFPVIIFVCMIGYLRALTLGPVSYAATRKGKTRKGYLNHRVASFARAVQCMLFFVFLWYPGLCQRLFRLFKCIDISGKSYLAADLSVPCWEGDHDFYARAAGCFIAIYVVGIPFGIYCVLMANRSTILADRRNKRTDLCRARFGVLFEALKPQLWYFELVDMARKMLLAGGLVLVEYDSPVQTLIGILVCLGFVTFTLRSNPYRLRVDNLFQDITSWHLLFTLLIGLWITATRAVGVAGITMGTSIYEEHRCNQLLLILFYVTLCVFSFMFFLLIPCVRECMQPLLGCLDDAFCLGGATHKTGAADAPGGSPRRAPKASSALPPDSSSREQLELGNGGDWALGGGGAGVDGMGGGMEMPPLPVDPVQVYSLEELAAQYPMATQEQLQAIQMEQQQAAMQQQQQMEQMAYQEQQMDMQLAGDMSGMGGSQQLQIQDGVGMGVGVEGGGGTGNQSPSVSGSGPGGYPRSPNQEDADTEAYINSEPVQFKEISQAVSAPSNVQTGAIYQF